MIYEYIDVIPAKTILKIESSLNLELLRPFIRDKNPAEVWKRIEEEHQDISPSGADKEIDLYKNIEGLKAKYEAVQLAVKYLSQLWDYDLVELLAGYGYKIPGGDYLNLEDVSRVKDHQEAIAAISKQSEAILFRLNNALKKVKKPKKTKGTSFEETVLSYLAFTRIGYVDPNKITLVEYYALVNLGQEKIKSLEKSGGKK